MFNLRISSKREPCSSPGSARALACRGRRLADHPTTRKTPALVSELETTIPTGGGAGWIHARARVFPNSNCIVTAKRIAALASAALAALVFFLCLVAANVAGAADDSAVAPPATAPGKVAPAPSVSASQLDKAINDTIHQPKYTWRMPREKIEEPESEHGPFVRFLIRAAKYVGNLVRDALKWIVELLGKWLQRMFVDRGTTHSSGVNWMAMLQVLMFVLLAVVLCALAVLLFRVWTKSRRDLAIVNTIAVAPVPDLRDENAGADQLPEDGWIKLGRKLLSQGEFRLALRAFYFASLAHLAGRNLLTIAKFKSNRDYERELGRRGHSLPDLVSLFGENVMVFDRSWYGLHDVNEEIVGHFAANVERIKAFG
jgi:hypothetical protein